MSEPWLPGAEVINNAMGAGGTYLSNVPWRLVLHSTEVIPDNLNGARAMAARHPVPPQLWAWYEEDWVGQTIPLTRSGFALAHPTGTPATNKMRALQVEIIGHAINSKFWTNQMWEWLASRVVAPLIRAGYPIDLDRLGATTGNDGYGTSGRVRFSRVFWSNFSGICCHSNVPDNKHWDIGIGNLPVLARATKVVLNPPPPIPEPEPTPPEEPMLPDVPPVIYADPADGKHYLVASDFSSKFWIPSHPEHKPWNGLQVYMTLYSNRGWNGEVQNHPEGSAILEWLRAIPELPNNYVPR